MIVQKTSRGTWVQGVNGFILVGGTIENEKGELVAFLDHDGVEIRQSSIPKVNRERNNSKETSE